MDVGTIIALIGKGLTVIQLLSEAAKPILPAIESLRELMSKWDEGEITEEDLQKIEAILDQQISDFNLPMADVQP